MCEGDGVASMSGAWDAVRPIPKCWLGVHQKISKEQADAMRGASKRRPKIQLSPLPMHN